MRSYASDNTLVLFLDVWQVDRRISLCDTSNNGSFDERSVAETEPFTDTDLLIFIPIRYWVSIYCIYETRS